MQKLSRALVVAQLKDDPRIDGVEAIRRLFEAARVEKIEALLKPQGPDAKTQMDMAMTQANLGKARAAETKDVTQAILNLALARKNVDEAEMGRFDMMIQGYRTHLEALNTQIKAADVDAKFYGHNVKMQQTQDKAGIAADDTKNAIDTRAARIAAPPSPVAQPNPVGAQGSG